MKEGLDRLFILSLLPHTVACLWVRIRNKKTCP